MNSPIPPKPPCLPQFERVNRYWDKSQKFWVAKILPGEYYVTRQAEWIATTLGSCVSACIRDSRLGIGGMNHFMLPIRQEEYASGLDAATRYGSYAMEHLINDILKLGGSRKYLEIKLTGGGQILHNMSDIGKKNIEFVFDYLQIEQLPYISADVGDIYPRKVLYDPKTGRMMTKKLRTLHNDTLYRREVAYRHELEVQPDSGGVELF